MSLQNATPVVLAFAHAIARPRCPQCGDLQLAPESAEFSGAGLVRNTWWCETCGNEFDTAVEFVAA